MGLEGRALPCAVATLDAADGVQRSLGPHLLMRVVVQQHLPLGGALAAAAARPLGLGPYNAVGLLWRSWQRVAALTQARALEVNLVLGVGAVE